MTSQADGTRSEQHHRPGPSMRIGGPRPAKAPTSAPAVSSVQAIPPRRAKRVQLKCRVCLLPDDPKVCTQRACVLHRASAGSVCFCLLADAAVSTCWAEHVRALFVLQKKGDRAGSYTLPQGVDRVAPGLLRVWTRACCIYLTRGSVCGGSNATTLPQLRGAPFATMNSRDCVGETLRGRHSAAKRVLM